MVVIEWQTTRIVNGARLDWRGVDKFRLQAGRIVEERVYTDTAPLRAARSGVALEPIMRLQRSGTFRLGQIVRRGPHCI